MRYQDIHIDDKGLWNQFTQAYKDNQYNDAISILKNNTQLNTKVANATNINVLNTAVYGVEHLYWADVIDVLAQYLENYQKAIDNLIDKGDYDDATMYTQGNFVIYNALQYVYIAGTDTSGHLPTDTAYWLYLPIKGEQGSYALDLTVKGDWDNTTQYEVKDVVVFSDGLYYAKKANANKSPDISADDWGTLIAFEKGKIVVSKNEPTTKYYNQVWFEEE